MCLICEGKGDGGWMKEQGIRWRHLLVERRRRRAAAHAQHAPSTRILGLTLTCRIMPTAHTMCSGSS